MNQKTLQKQIGKKISRELKNQGISQAELARKMKLEHPGSLKNIIQGERNLTLKMICRISSGLGVDLIKTT